MAETSRVRVYLGCSLDGCIAGPDDDLSWLHSDSESSDGPSKGEPPPSDALDFVTFMGQVGAMLMGRRTYDVIAGMGVWPYGETPVLVATRRPLATAQSTVRPIAGDIAEVVAEAQRIAGEKDVYLDGGALARQALDAGLVDEMVLTYVPIILGDGIRLFDGLTTRSHWTIAGHTRMGHGMLQVTLRAAGAGG